MAKRQLRTLDNKYYLYCFSTGDTELIYFRKYINEVLKNKIDFLPKKELITQINPYIKNNNKDFLIKSIISFIERRIPSNNYGAGKIIVIITDCDKTKLKNIEDFRQRFNNTFEDRTLFILNYQIYYYDKQEEKDKIRNDVINNWDKVFKDKHINAVNKYLKEYSQEEAKTIENYSDINANKYSDFPYAFQFLEQI